jgi:hypothetical protein
MGANAVTTTFDFTTGQVLTAAQMDNVNCGVPVFATTATRDAAFGGTGEKVLAEGQTCYIEAAPNRLQIYDGATWRPVDVEWTSYTPTVTAGTGTFTTVSSSGKYVVIGKTVVIQFEITITTNGTAGQDVRFTTPFAATAIVGGASVGSARDVSVTGNMINVFAVSSTVLACVGVSNAYPGANGVQIGGYAMSEVS